jgi:site-specific recombinase XerD
MLEKLVKEFIEEQRLSGRAPNTCDCYQDLLKRFVQWCKQNNVDFKTLTPRQTRAFRNWLVSENLAPNTINMAIYTLRQFYDFLTEEEIVSGNPVIPKRLCVPVTETLPRFLTDEELERVMPHIQKNKQRLVFLTMLATGLRVSEVLALRPQDVLVQNGRVFLRVVRSKTRKQRLAPVTDPQVAQELLKLREAKRGQPRLFPITTSTVREHASNIAAKSGVEHFSSHCLRHTFATRLLNGGEIPLDVVQELLGHECILSTRRYAKTLPTRFFQYAAKVG